MAGAGRGALPRHRRGGLWRCRQDQGRSAEFAATLHCAAIRRSGRADAQHHRAAAARHRAGHHPRRHQLLRRPGFPGAEVAGREERQRDQRRHDLPADRHVQREHAGRLGARQQRDVQAGGDRDVQRSGQRVRRGPLRRLFHGRIGPGFHPHLEAAESRRLRRAARDHLERAAGSLRAPG
ncbi:hypothetical protein G6F50_015732 [Rhizopus delemar]|uniref:Uncharacterized protein n=1 Tax=Rhizopus delemar TaxID=936053 RepID=A0A9P7C383_9FUNG|nr:hypothetical protein G6F50_015732 [Rhizopus delemar]